MKTPFWVLSLPLTLASACGSSSDGESRGEAGAAGMASMATGGGGSAGLAGGATGGSAAGSGGAGGSTPNDVIEGDLWGEPVDAAGSIAQLGPSSITDRGYVSVSISDWVQTCAQEEGCPGAQVNFTLYVNGGTNADLQPGVYTPEGEARNGFVHEVVGGAGRYDATCSTQGGFPGFTTGNVTLETIGPRVTGTIDLTLEDGGHLTGRFDAELCN